MAVKTKWELFKQFAPQVFSLCYMIFTIITVVINYNNLNSFNIAFNQIFNNWQSNIMTDIVLSSTTSCPSQYQPLVAYSFAGTTTGYFCTYQNNKLIKWSASCTQGNLTYKPSVPDVSTTVSAQTLYYWGRTSATSFQQICYKPYTSYSFYNNLTLYKNGQCPTGYITCGGPNAATITCLPSGTPCPIDQISITTGSCAVGSTNCLTLDAVSGKIITWQSNSTNTYPIVEARINEYAMCIDANDENITPGRAVYALNNRASTSCTSNLQTNYSWSLLDTVSESYFFGINSILTSMDALPQMNETRGYNYYLFARKYFDLNIECRSRLNDLQSTNKEQTALLRIFLATIIMDCIMFIALLVSACWQWSAVKGENEPSLNKAMLCGSIAGRLLDVFNITVKSISFALSNNVNSTFGYFKNCSNDATYNDTIGTIAKYFININTLTIVLLAVSCASFVFQIIMLIIKCRKAKTYSPVEPISAQRRDLCEYWYIGERESEKLRMKIEKSLMVNGGGSGKCSRKGEREVRDEDREASSSDKGGGGSNRERREERIKEKRKREERKEKKRKEKRMKREEERYYFS